MRVYFVTQKDMGLSVLLEPRKPESAPLSEGEIARICVSNSILGALSSVGGNLCLGCNTYIYSCDLDESELIQPGLHVNDVDYTGELWILIKKEFTLYKIIKLNDVNSFYIDREKEIKIYHFVFNEVVI